MKNVGTVILKHGVTVPMCRTMVEGVRPHCVAPGVRLERVGYGIGVGLALSGFVGVRRCLLCQQTLPPVDGGFCEDFTGE